MNLGMPEMIFIFLLALVVFGPRKLPELGRQLGKALAEFKRASNEFKNQLEVEMMNIELEERVKKQEELPLASGDSGRTILPAEKLPEMPGAPPDGSVSRSLSEMSGAVPKRLDPETHVSSMLESDPTGSSVSPNA